MPEYKITLIVDEHDIGIAISRFVFSEDDGEAYSTIKRISVEEVRKRESTAPGARP